MNMIDAYTCKHVERDIDDLNGSPQLALFFWHVLSRSKYSILSGNGIHRSEISALRNLESIFVEPLHLNILLVILYPVSASRREHTPLQLPATRLPHASPVPLKLSKIHEHAKPSPTSPHTAQSPHPTPASPPASGCFRLSARHPCHPRPGRRRRACCSGTGWARW